MSEASRVFSKSQTLLNYHNKNILPVLEKIKIIPKYNVVNLLKK